MHRTRIPSLALALVLQVVPVARVVTTQAAVATPVFAIIARCAAAIAALLGAADAVSGASVAVTVAGVQSVLPASPGVKTNITGKVGTPMVLRIVLAGSVGQQPQLDYYNATPLPPGLTINTNVNTNSVGLASTNYYIYGTPTAAGVWYPVRVSAGNLLYPTVTSTNILITITNAGGTAPPAFTTQPQSQTVTNGGSATFSAAASGSPSFQWRHNGASLAGATSATYNIPTTSTNDAGDYTVVASNTGGSVTSVVATLTVLVPPRIVAPPQNLTVAQGATATFEVVAEGWPAPSYQWQFNNAALAGQISPSLTITNVQATNEGDYSVVVSNSAGSITTSTAHLTVEPPAGPITLTNLQLGAEGAGFDVNGPASVPIVIWASPDLANWSPIHTNSNPSTSWHFSDTTAPPTSSRFYRAQRHTPAPN